MFSIPLIIGFFALFLTVLFSSLMGPVSIATIPYIGLFLSSTLTDVVHIWNAFMVTFPYAQIGWDVFLYAIVPFEIAFLSLKFFLGSRMPNNHN